MRGREELTDDVVCKMIEVKIVLVVSERICIIGEFGLTVTGDIQVLTFDLFTCHEESEENKALR